MSAFTFVPAAKTQGKARVALAGPSGSGKSYSALAIARGLAGDDGRIAVINTEHGSASKYAAAFHFDVLALEPPFHPRRFVEAIEAAGSAGYDVLIVDSLSHAWAGSGGVLELVDVRAAQMKTKNTFSAWKDVTPLQNQLVDHLVRAPLHIICTMRSRTAYVIESLERDGRVTSVPRKIGLAPIQKADFEYEFDVVGELDLDHTLVVTKTRCPDLDGVVIRRPDANLGRTIAAWLSDGTAVKATTRTEATDNRTAPGVQRSVEEPAPRPSTPRIVGELPDDWPVDDEAQAEG